jgi:SsrA-binding protein
LDFKWKPVYDWLRFPRSRLTVNLLDCLVDFTFVAVMSGKKAKNGTQEKSAAPNHFKLIAENRQARHHYEILEELECGICLIGSEVKSLREGKISLNEAYVRVSDGDLWLVGADIGEYRQAAVYGHLPKRNRKLLVRKRQLLKLTRQVQEKGLSLIPTRIYFNGRGLVKLNVAVGRGKKLHDKRESLKKADVQRQISREMRNRSR